MSSSIFEVFKIVLGIIIGGFFLYFMLQFAGIYTTTEARSADIQEYKNLKSLIEDTYIYSIPTTFDLKNPPAFASPPFISESSAISVNPSILFFFQPKRDDSDLGSAPKPMRFSVYRGPEDLGFLKMYFVGALPEKRIFYSMDEYPLDHYSLIQNITELFPQSVDPLIDFGFCDGGTKFITNSTEAFLKPIRGIVRTKSPQNLNLSLCTADLQNQETKIIITNKDIPAPEKGFVIKTPLSGLIGSISFKEKDMNGKMSEYKLVYKDPLDIFSVIIGGVEAYKFKNKLVFQTMLTFSKAEARRTNTISQALSDPVNKRQECLPIYSKLKIKLDGEFKTFLESVLKLENYNDPIEMEKYVTLMAEVNGIYSELRAKGCE